MSKRFRGFLPVVVDVETAGFNPQRDALLEIAAVLLTMDDDGWLHRGETYVQQIDPFEGANLEQSALDFTGIDPWNPEREAVPEREGLSEIFSPIRKAVKTHDCKRAVLVGHNAKVKAPSGILGSASDSAWSENCLVHACPMSFKSVDGWEIMSPKRYPKYSPLISGK